MISIKKYKDSYDISALKNFLISHGYTPEDVEKAAKIATQQK